MTNPTFTITRLADRQDNLATYRIDGKRISGTVDVRIDINERSRSEYRADDNGMPDDGNPLEWEDVVILAWGDDCELTINGIVYSGSDSMRMNNRFNPFGYAGQHSIRRRNDFMATPTDAARRMMREAFQAIATDYYSPATAYAARVRDAVSAVERATGKRDDAQGELDAATAKLDALRATTA